MEPGLDSAQGHTHFGRKLRQRDAMEMVHEHHVSLFLGKALNRSLQSFTSQPVEDRALRTVSTRHLLIHQRNDLAPGPFTPKAIHQVVPCDCG